jgi:hypothetical protein
MLEQSVIEGWKFLASQGKSFHSDTVMALISHIEELENINDSLVHECETWESRYIREEEQEMRHGNA